MDNMRIIQFGPDEFGVYRSGYRGPYGTPLVFVGTLDEVLAYRKENT
jgi:hypothetical protein